MKFKVFWAGLCVLLAAQVYAADDVQHISISASRVKRDLRVSDGDTIRFRFRKSDGLKMKNGKTYVSKSAFGDSIRLAGYDTPEKFAPSIGMFFNQPKGKEASDFAKELIYGADRIIIHTEFAREDNGRLLGYLELKYGSDTVLLGEALIKNGLAYEGVFFYRERAKEEGNYDPRFKKYEDRMIRAWRKSPIYRAITDARHAAEEGDRKGIEAAVKRIPFMAPYLWRQFNNHQICKSRNKITDCRRLLVKRSHINKMDRLLKLGRKWNKLTEEEKFSTWDLAKEVSRLKIPGVNKKFRDRLPIEFGIQALHTSYKFVAEDWVNPHTQAAF